MLFWIAATYKPKKKNKDDVDKQEELIIEPTIVIAKDDKTAAMKTTVGKADVLGKYDLECVNIFVRPF
jgi:hypothetical protein